MEVPVVTFGPQMLVSAGLDQFRRDANPVPFARTEPSTMASTLNSRAI